ncbi:MAG: hydroxyphenylacetyl-CoA thioesterase PaaI [Pseudomonadota bacterium]
MQDQARAERSAAVMLEQDRASAWFGIALDRVGPGVARMTLTVGEDHLNGHGTCHGGVIFALADSAFAVACNSSNRKAVAQHNTISYLSPGHLGERLTAEANVVARTGRSAITDVTVTGDDGRIVAAFRGASREIGGHHFQEDT